MLPGHLSLEGIMVLSPIMSILFSSDHGVQIKWKEKQEADTSGFVWGWLFFMGLPHCSDCRWVDSQSGAGWWGRDGALMAP